MTETSADSRLVVRIAETIEREGLQGLDIHYDELCSPEFEWRPRMVGSGEETYVGRDGYRRYLEELVVTVTNVSFRVEGVSAAGAGRVLVLGYLTLTGRDGGEPVETEYALLCVVEAERLRTCTAFSSHAEAKEAAADA